MKQLVIAGSVNSHIDAEYLAGEESIQYLLDKITVESEVEGLDGTLIYHNIWMSSAHFVHEGCVEGWLNYTLIVEVLDEDDSYEVLEHLNLDVQLFLYGENLHAEIEFEGADLIDIREDS